MTTDDTMSYSEYKQRAKPKRSRRGGVQLNFTVSPEIKEFLKAEALANDKLLRKHLAEILTSYVSKRRV